MLESLKKFAIEILNGHEFLGPDGFRLEPDDPCREIHLQISQYLQEIEGKISYDIKPKDAPMGLELLDHTYPNQVTLVMALVARLGNENRKQRYYHSNYLAALLRPLLTRRLPYTEPQLLDMLTFIASKKYIDVPLVSLLGNVQRYLESQPLSTEMWNVLQTLRKAQSDAYDKKPLKKIDDLLGESSTITPDAGEAWADAARAHLDLLPEAGQEAWQALFGHALHSETAKPSAKWIKEAETYWEAVGKEELTRHLAAWLKLVVPPPPFDRTAPKYEGANVMNNAPIYAEYQRASAEYHTALREYHKCISEKNIALLKGLAWYASACDTPDVARGLGHMVEAAFSPVRERGTWAARAGNAGIWALGQMPGGLGVGPLARLRTRLRDRGALKLVAAAIESAAETADMTVDELEDLAVPTGGLDADGTRQETFGEEGAARLTLDAATGRTRLEWFGADGKPRKAVPAGVKRGFAAEVKALKAAEEEVTQALSAQASRFDGFLLNERVWPLAVWRERYGNHPILGNLARRLIWAVGGVPALPVGDTFQDISGQALEGLADDAPVCLWHPISAPPEVTLRWRDALEARGLVQPFKQAHREVYLLTDAERNTRTYSNRFAAHVLKQHQFNSLCILRGWKNTLRLMVDDSYPPATRVLPQHGLRAEFWVEGIGDDYRTDTNDAGTYLRVATDQVRFYREDAAINYAHAGGGGYAADRRAAPAEPLLLDQVPPLALSEIMRDVDLFVGVASVGNDPAWSDGGPEGRFRDYWRDYAFGDLGETAKTRADVLGRLLPRLKIASRCRLDGKFLIVRGDLRSYKIHLGSGNILMEPNDQYLCIVPGRSEDSGDLFLPFEGDRMLAIILSKAFLLADDKAIKDQTIVSQIKR